MIQKSKHGMTLRQAYERKLADKQIVKQLSELRVIFSCGKINKKPRY
jgi:hypothetical protein